MPIFTADEPPPLEPSYRYLPEMVLDHRKLSLWNIITERKYLTTDFEAIIFPFSLFNKKINGMNCSNKHLMVF